MILLLFLFGLALGAESPSGEPVVKLQRGGCPPFWFNFKGRCYKYVSSRMTWADAELHCLSEGTNLVSIHSQSEDDFIRSLIRNFDPLQGYTWIGLSDTQKEGSWMWSDGSTGNFRLWDQGQPDNHRGVEHCVEYNFASQKRWNDRKCSASYPFVCKTRFSCN